MKMQKEIEIKIYVKHKLRPIRLVVGEKELENFKSIVLDPIIVFGPIVIPRESIKYVIME